MEILDNHGNTHLSVNSNGFITAIHDGKELELFSYKDKNNNIISRVSENKGNLQYPTINPSGNSTFTGLEKWFAEVIDGIGI